MDSFFTFEPSVASSDLLKVTDTSTATTMTEIIDRSIRVIPDYPEEGIQYRDLTTIWMDHRAFKTSVSAMECLSKVWFNKVVGVEAYGWVYAAIIAGRTGKPFVPIRKHGKLPSKTVEIPYRNDRDDRNCLCIHEDALSSDDRVLLVDDLITTGESIKAACKCIENLGAKVEKIIALIDFADKGGKEKLIEQGYKVATVITYSKQ